VGTVYLNGRSLRRAERAPAGEGYSPPISFEFRGEVRRQTIARQASRWGLPNEPLAPGLGMKMLSSIVGEGDGTTGDEEVRKGPTWRLGVRLQITRS